MLFGSYIAGSLPLTTKLSENKIRLFNALGAGLLIGTSLMVVIPEGVETIYNNGFENLSKRSPSDHGTEKGGEHTAIGLSLIIGFSLMYIIDQVSSLHLHSPVASTEYTELGAVGGGNLEREEEHVEEVQHVHRISNQPSITPTVGLIVHAAADGIALGASATHPQLSMVVFIAIMLHKAPASFALTSVLLAAGLSRTAIRKHLLLFSLAAPVGALLTFFALYFFSSSTTSAASLEYWTGVLLVFSGGTFLYVAMHALQEVSHSSDHSEKMDKAQLLIILTGMFIPILLSMTHSH
ncbi:Zinc/iron permease [Helicostylum pulchrum]|nr:Zinc/iron permease [Helicostylum pulchrum]